MRFGKGIPTDIYLVQERIAGADEQWWTNMSVLEVLCSREVEALRVPDRASNESRAAGDKSREPTAASWVGL
jgi:hypothetical protein